MKKLNVFIVSVNAPPNMGAESLQVGMHLKYLAPQINGYLITKAPETRGWNKADPNLLEYTKALVARIEVTSAQSKASEALRRKLKLGKKFPGANPLFADQEKAVIKAAQVAPDLIYSRNQPPSSALLALKLAKHYGVPWVMHLSDPWSTNVNFEASHREKHRAAERDCVENAAVVTVTTDQTKQLFSQLYPEMKGKFVVMPNVYDPATAKKLAPDFSQNKLQLVHCGNLYGIANAKPLFDALSMIRTKQPELLNELEVTFAGNMTEENVRLFNAFKHRNVNYIGRLPFAAALKLQEKAHMLMFIDRPLKSFNEGVHMHSKVQISMSMGKPMLGIGKKSCQTCVFVQDHYGKCFDFDETEMLNDYLIQAINAFRNKDATFFATDEIDEFYAADQNANRLVKIFNELVD
jgi:glycosyltransferase involved in cell wall biosynthesis